MLALNLRQHPASSHGTAMDVGVRQSGGEGGSSASHGVEDVVDVKPAAALPVALLMDQLGSRVLLFWRALGHVPSFHFMCTTGAHQPCWV